MITRPRGTAFGSASPTSVGQAAVGGQNPSVDRHPPSVGRRMPPADRQTPSSGHTPYTRALRQGTRSWGNFRFSVPTELCAIRVTSCHSGIPRGGGRRVVALLSAVRPCVTSIHWSGEPPGALLLWYSL